MAKNWILPEHVLRSFIDDIVNEADARGEYVLYPGPWASEIYLDLAREALSQEGFRVLANLSLEAFIAAILSKRKREEVAGQIMHILAWEIDIEESDLFRDDVFEILMGAALAGIAEAIQYRFRGVTWWGDGDTIGDLPDEDIDSLWKIVAFAFPEVAEGEEDVKQLIVEWALSYSEHMHALGTEIIDAVNKRLEGTRWIVEFQDGDLYVVDVLPESL